MMQPLFNSMLVMTSEELRKLLRTTHIGAVFQDGEGHSVRVKKMPDAAPTHTGSECNKRGCFFYKRTEMQCPYLRDCVSIHRADGISVYYKEVKT